MTRSYSTAPPNESTVEEAALAWLSDLGWGVAHGLDIGPGTPGAERDDHGQVRSRLSFSLGDIRHPARSAAVKADVGRGTDDS